MHVAGFTRHPSSGVAAELRGTYAGMIEKIPYLRDLGITAVELLPIFQFDRQDSPAGLVNYWGYSPVSFFAPHAGYSSRKDALGPIDEFRDLVKALHRAGIEVILDVVYNHTAEGDERGPTLSFRGLANEAYYILEQDRARFANYSGTGNTLNANQAIVRRMILDSLRYWVREMHVDGFRFDLAAILARDETGRPLENPPVLWDIESDPVLAGTKLIAEAWDAAGLYQVGSFVGDSWKEWNGRFRDDVRGFVKGDRGTVRMLASRVLGSPDIFGHEEREPEQSLNFVTCHDGFTLNDLVSYNGKHNEANGEGNRDGADNNLSWNCGVEGPSEDEAVESLRRRQVKNFIVMLLTSIGTPMLLMGDEMRRTQRGNNNAYCQDNEVSWLDWSLLDRHRDLHRFVKMLIAHRLRGMAMRDEESLRTDPQRTAAPRRNRLARRPARLPGLVRQLAQHCLHHSARSGSPSISAPSDVQRLLGSARLRAAAAAEDGRFRLAALDRHGARGARGHCGSCRGAARAGDAIRRGAAFHCGAARADRRLRCAGMRGRKRRRSEFRDRIVGPSTPDQERNTVAMRTPRSTPSHVARK